MAALGFKPTKNSGSGWVEKEDGHNDFLIAQLKSTDASSMSLKQKDISILEYNASICHKLPCFVIQFLQTNEVYVMAKPQDLVEVAKYIETGVCDVPDPLIGTEELEESTKKKVKSSPEHRKIYEEEREKKWKRK